MEERKQQHQQVVCQSGEEEVCQSGEWCERTWLGNYSQISCVPEAEGVSTTSVDMCSCPED